MEAQERPTWLLSAVLSHPLLCSQQPPVSVPGSLPPQNSAGSSHLFSELLLCPRPLWVGSTRRSPAQGQTRGISGCLRAEEDAGCLLSSAGVCMGKDLQGHAYLHPAASTVPSAPPSSLLDPQGCVCPQTPAHMLVDTCGMLTGLPPAPRLPGEGQAGWPLWDSRFPFLRLLCTEGEPFHLLVGSSSWDSAGERSGHAGKGLC